jgi:hypothetical protein
MSVAVPVALGMRIELVGIAVSAVPLGMRIESVGIAVSAVPRQARSCPNNLDVIYSPSLGSRMN